MGDTFALRLSLGKVTVVRLRLYISVIAGTSSSAQVFIILFGNPSDPLALLVFKFASSFCTPAVVMSNLFILVYSFPGILGRGSSMLIYLYLEMEITNADRMPMSPSAWIFLTNGKFPDINIEKKVMLSAV